MSLPLIQRAREDGVTFVLAPSLKAKKSSGLYQIASAPDARIPSRKPDAGEQYRFHFDMSKCIGCKCCVVACNEQNGNPAAIQWRRVGEIEGGYYPDTSRFYLSMGCNHCVEPTCLTGCPTEAYIKATDTGVVLHNADDCIGCQYCTWNCSYGVPQYNPERGVVGKCDMCHHRLAEDREPACVSACPQGAIAIEIVNVEQWRSEYAESANAPGLPSADDSLSTTRLTLPAKLPPDTGQVNAWRVKPEHPHWPLVIMLVLTQLSVGAFTAIWLLDALVGTDVPFAAALASFAAGAMALAASTLHLGRPAYAWRALKMWKRSWLSREVLVFSLFSVVASVYSAALGAKVEGLAALGALTAFLGIAGIVCSAFIYLVPARPAWNMRYTMMEFLLTAATLGPLFASAAGLSANHWLSYAAAAGAAAQLLTQTLKFLRLIRSNQYERQASARLLSGTLRQPLLWRSALLVAGGVMLPLLTSGALASVIALSITLASEILGRYLFFTSVVPKNMASTYQVGQAA